MNDTRTLDELKDLGAGRVAPEGVAGVYRQAFVVFGTRALWNWREVDARTIAQALAVAESLRTEGNLEARALAAQIEQACCAAL